MDNYYYLAHMVITTDKPVTREQIEELAGYLQLTLDDGTNVRAEVTNTKRI